MDKILVEISTENLKFIRDRKLKEYVPIKMSVNEALNMLRKKEADKKEIENAETT